MTTMTAAQAHEAIASVPPMPDTRIVDAIAVGQAIRQGDVYLLRIERPAALGAMIADRQLAPGTTQGSRHVLGDGPGIHAGGSDDPLLGPVIIADERFVLAHPEHAHFSLPAGCYQVRYQQDLREAERRAVRD